MAAMRVILTPLPHHPLPSPRALDDQRPQNFERSPLCVTLPTLQESHFWGLAYALEPLTARPPLSPAIVKRPALLC